MIRKARGLIKALLGFVTRGNRGVSRDYSIIRTSEVSEVASHLRDSWKNSQIPERQRELVRTQLEQFKHGKRVDVFNSLIEIMNRNIHNDGAMKVLEIGCSSGYYSEVLKQCGLPVVYEGCDYSPSFINLARQLYPNEKFIVQDAVSLDYEDNSYDVVISGCCLLHIENYSGAVKEAARVSRRHVLFHRTPVMPNAPTKYYTKKAYGVPTFEIHFNKDELLGLFKAHGLKPVDEIVISDGTTPEGDVVQNITFYCRKVLPEG